MKNIENKSIQMIKEITKSIKNLFALVIMSFFLLVALGCFTGVQAGNIYRVNNSATGEHLYTVSSLEVQTLVCSGWTDEGICWVSDDSGEGVYRLYNPNYPGGDHLYTQDLYEMDVLTKQQGWQADNNAQPLFYSAGSVPVYRLLDQRTGRHHLTTDENEYNVLPSQGWKQEGVSLNCTQGAEGFLSPSEVRARIMSLQSSYPEGMHWDNSNTYQSHVVFYESDEVTTWSTTIVGGGCQAFALICSDTAFGDLPARVHNNKNDIKVGDLLRINNDTHAVSVLEVSGDRIVVAEGNWGEKIHWGRTISRNSTDIKYILTRYPGYNEPNDVNLILN